MESLAQIVKGRAGELEGKWVALVSAEYLPPPPIPAGTSINDIYASDVSRDPLTDFDVLCEVDFTQKVCGEDKGTRGGQREWHLVISDEPFVVKMRDDAGIGNAGQSNYHIVKAQKVSSGELGRKPDVPMPHFTRGAKGWSWVRLTDLADAIRLFPAALWEEYYAIGRDVLADPGMEVCIGGCGRDRQVVRINAVRELFPYSEEERYEFSRIWVPAGWAADVCYLTHFGRLNERRIAWLPRAPRVPSL